MPLVCCDFWNSRSQQCNLFTNIAKHFKISVSGLVVVHSVNGNEYLKKVKTARLTILYSGEPHFNPRHDRLVVTYLPTGQRGPKHYVQVRDFEFYQLSVNFQYPVAPIYRQVNDKWQCPVNPKTRDVCFVVSNPKCWQRNLFFNMLKSRVQVVSAGKVFQNSHELDRVPFRSQRHLNFISQFKMMICFENTSLAHYLTEKIYYCFLAGTVPIYWGDPQVTKSFNPESFVHIPTAQTRTEQVAIFHRKIDEIVELLSDPVGLNRFYSVKPVTDPQGEEDRLANSIELIRDYIADKVTH